MPFKTKKVLWQLHFAHARFSQKPYYDVRQVLETRIPNLKSIAILVRAVEWFQTDRRTNVQKPLFQNRHPPKRVENTKSPFRMFDPIAILSLPYISY